MEAKKLTWGNAEAKKSRGVESAVFAGFGCKNEDFCLEKFEKNAKTCN